MPDVEEQIVIPKQEDLREASPASSIDSTGEVDADGELDGNVNLPPVVPQKRKGGRKPIYATSEERKQRNRQAQAAFRERRTEYIKQLEATIKRQEDSLLSLQQSHRTAADECLMLRYKNSLLERILLEKGIDVQAELQRKEVLPTTRLPQVLPQPAPIRKPTARARTTSRLSSSSIPGPQKILQSPNAMSTQSSQVSSPIKSTGYNMSGGIDVSNPGYQSPQSVQSGHTRRPSGRIGLQTIAPNPGPMTGHWPSPFQSHNEQLEQEYGNHADDAMDADEQVDDPHQGPGPYPQAFTPQNYITTQGYAIPAGSPGDSTQSGHGYDEIDPFGLSASMHFPTPFTYQESAMRK